MKKLLSIVLVVLMLGVVFSGCGGPATQTDGVDLLESSTEEEADDKTDVVDTEKTDEGAADNNTSGSTGTASESYTAYIEAKGVMLTKLMDGLGNNPDTAMTVMSFLGVSMVDLILLPASLFGLGQEGVAAGLGFLGATGVQYTENGNNYSVSYKDADGAAYVFNGTYDPAADALICTATKDGKEYIYSEYYKTSFGYVGQVFTNNDDGTTNLYKIAIEGEDGTIGMSMTETAKPAALTGSEEADFATTCPEWYAVHGTTITGKTSDGTALDFEFTPSPAE